MQAGIPVPSCVVMAGLNPSDPPWRRSGCMIMGLIVMVLWGTVEFPTFPSGCRRVASVTEVVITGSYWRPIGLEYMARFCRRVASVVNSITSGCDSTVLSPFSPVACQVNWACALALVVKNRAQAAMIAKTVNFFFRVIIFSWVIVEYLGIPFRVSTIEKKYSHVSGAF